MLCFHSILYFYDLFLIPNKWCIYFSMGERVVLTRLHLVSIWASQEIRKMESFLLLINHRDKQVSNLVVSQFPLSSPVFMWMQRNIGLLQSGQIMIYWHETWILSEVNFLQLIKYHRKLLRGTGLFNCTLDLEIKQQHSSYNFLVFSTWRMNQTKQRTITGLESNQQINK